MIELITLPLFACILLASITGPLGCFVVWQRMAYFGDTVAHAALIGVAIGLTFNIGILAGIVFTSIIVAVLTALGFSRNSNTSVDARLGILAHGSLAVGLLLIGLMASNRINLFAILTGDLLTISHSDLLILAAACSIILLTVIKLWQPFLMLVIDNDLAQVEQIPTHRHRVILTVIIAISIALGVQLVGAILISALLIIPAVSARQISSSPESMALIATLLALLSSISGLMMSAIYDAASGPMIVCMALLLLVCANVYARVRAK